MARLCPECHQPMRRFLTGWKCMNVKAHSRAGKPGNPRQTRKPNNPRGINRKPPKPKGKGKWVLTVCPTCQNGRRFDPRKCGLCKKYGRIWTIK